ncbi:MAG: twin-arginine translocase subunit TatB [Cypionkella sp.]|nr:twin-arginine translocase subunit TatB [Cypionkella sp.]
MFDIGASELLVVGVVALIVIGPKDLPDMFRQVGRFTAKIRAMGREFSRAMEEAAKESGVADVAKDVKAATSAKSLGLDAVKNAADRFEKWDPIKNAVKPTASPAARVITPVAAAEPVAGVTPEMGPATKALAQKQAAKKAILAETAEKLKAVNAPTPVVKKAAAKPRAKPAAETAPVAPKPRAPRKTVKKAEEA